MIKLTSHEREVLRRVGSDPDVIAQACHKRPKWINELMAVASAADSETRYTDQQECPHDSMSGDEGPVALLGRMPVRWRCEACDVIVYDDVNEEQQ